MYKSMRKMGVHCQKLEKLPASTTRCRRPFVALMTIVVVMAIRGPTCHFGMPFWQSAAILAVSVSILDVIRVSSGSCDLRANVCGVFVAQ